MTHNASYFDKCDSVIVVSQGQILAQGTYKDLMMKNKILKDLVSSNAQQYDEHQTDHLSNSLDNRKLRRFLKLTNFSF